MGRIVRVISKDASVVCSAIAVSYTHLDVYKRQVLSRGVLKKYFSQEGNLPWKRKEIQVDL